MTTLEPQRFFHKQPLAIQNALGGELLTLAPLDLQALSDVRQSMRQALSEPEDFPAVCEAIVEGDRIVIAVDPNLPDLIACVVGALDAIASQNAGQIDVLLGEDGSPEILERLQVSVADQATVHLHDPDNSEMLGYLAASEAADPIYLNRLLLEADFVLPLAIARPSGALDPSSETGGIFPQFADRNSQQRHRELKFRQRPRSSKAASESDAAMEAAWLLGLQMIVEVLPTVDARAAEIVAGTALGVRKRLASATEACWRQSAPQMPTLVIAIVDGGTQQQNWNNLARAVDVASRLVDVGGTIAVCCDVTQTPGRSLRRLGSDASFEETLKMLRKDRSPDAFAANLLVRVREEYRILLATGLPSESLEDLGLGAIESVSGLQHLVDQHPTTAIIRGAQFCVAATENRDADSAFDPFDGTRSSS